MTQKNQGALADMAASNVPATRSGGAGTKLFGLLSLLVLAVILYAGLRPFHSRNNQVSWAPESHALRFGEYGTAVSQDSIPPPVSRNGERSLEIWMQPRWFDDSKTFLAFYDPAQPRQLWLRQVRGGLELRIAPSSAWRRTPASRLFVDDAFPKRKNVFLGITSSPSGTAIYEDGALLKRAPGFRISDAEFSGRLILGTAPIFSQSWPGVIRGLAIYDRELTSTEIARHYQTWTRQGRPALAPEDRNIALYLFDEVIGRTVHNWAGSAHDLNIPAKYMIVNQAVLDPIWRAMAATRGFWKDVVINVLGFVPLGFFLCAYLAARRAGRPALLAAALGAAISLFIELAQTQLPTRDSSMSDLIANSAGSALGAALWRAFQALVLDQLQP